MESSLKEKTISGRVQELKQRLIRHSENPDHDFKLEPVPATVIEQLENCPSYPQDMLMILKEIGCMRNWGHHGCAVINWWTPCTIGRANQEDRSTYELHSDFFARSSDLLFFACDVDAVCYFYDQSTVPWRIGYCDGLSISLDIQTASHRVAMPLSYFEEGSCALEIFEAWAAIE